MEKTYTFTEKQLSDRVKLAIVLFNMKINFAKTETKEEGFEVCNRAMKESVELIFSGYDEMDK